MMDIPDKIWIEHWELDVAAGMLSNAQQQHHLEPKVVDVLVLLVRNAGTLVTRDQFLSEVWDDRVVGDEVLTRCITELRQALGDLHDPRRYIETLPRRGYRLIANVGTGSATASEPVPLKFRGISALVALLLIPLSILLLTNREPSRESVSAPLASTIAVLPFMNLSPDPDNAYFTAGMHEEVLTKLSQVNQFNVISRTSVLNYEIARNIAEKLRTNLTPVEQARIARVPTSNIEAYEAFLRGRQKMSQRKTTALAEAVQFFQAAVNLDPQFALAYSSLADVYNLQTIYNGLPLDETLPKAKAAVRKALSLDDSLGEVWTTKAFIHMTERDYGAAEAAYLKAIQINPNYVTAHHWYGVMLIRTGRFEEALARIDNGLALDPLSSILHIARATALEYLGRFDDSLRVTDRVMEIDPQFQGGPSMKAHTYWYAFGQLDRALPYLLEARTLDPGTPYRSSNLADLYLGLDDVNKANYWIEQAKEIGPDVFAVQYIQFLLHLYRDEQVRATALATKLNAMRPRFWPTAVYLQNIDLRSGQTDKASRWIESAFPELSEEDPRIDFSNWEAALNLAMVMQKRGESDKANRLLALTRVVTQKLPRLGPDGSWLADVQIYALQGKSDKAINALREAIDIGWRGWWWFHLKLDLTLQSLHQNEEYQLLVDEVTADIAAQRARVNAIQL
jgi:serine/threonine-protein kinase